MSETIEEHRRLQAEAVEADGRGQRLLLLQEDARAEFSRAAALYRRSWEAAPPGAYGRLVGHVKAAVFAGDPVDAAAYVREQIGDDPPSPPAAWARALAALVEGDRETVLRCANVMREGSEAFARAADALVAPDDEAFEHAVRAIEADFAARTEHLTGVAIADTALVLRALRAG